MAVALRNVDTDSVRTEVGAAAYARGVAYARARAVRSSSWDDAMNAISGVVRGSGGTDYTTTAYLRTDRRGRSGLDFGECTCPVEVNCKHVAALMLAAMGVGRPAAAPSSTWEQSLAELLGGTSTTTGGTPIAAELAVTDGQRPGVHARLVRPGRNGGWAVGGLSWSKLEQPYQLTEFDTRHVQLLRELYALYLSGRRDRHGYGYRYGEEKLIDLGEFASPRLWPLLDEAAAIGIRLVQAERKLDDVARCDAELCLDVTHDERRESLVVAPVLVAGGNAVHATPVRFIGSNGHGVVCRDAEGRLQLVRLARPVPEGLRRMVLDGGRLDVPAAAEETLRDRYYPSLRRLAPMISSDGAFTPPHISAPCLMLRAEFRPGHRLGLSWEWCYRVGDAEQRLPVSVPDHDDGVRDPAAERAIVDGLLREVPLGEFGLLDAPDELSDGALLTGIDTMRFTTEVLPLLDAVSGVTVEVDGDQPEFREAGDTLRIGLSTDATPGETDWFDLGVTITIEERQVPFTEVFLALARGESHLLLDSGAYFSLEKPELQRLRRLIEEARELSDTGPSTGTGGGLRISRFQADLWAELAELGVIERQAASWQRQVSGLLSARDPGSVEPPGALTAQLRPYQLDGFAWLAFLWEHRLGGILADDMGLGKTLQALALICHAKQADPDLPPFLIVAPTSVVPNWAAEATRFAPSLRVAAISETERRRGTGLDEVVAGADVVVTSYALFRLEFDGYAARGWSGLILDEAQFAKNHRSKAYQCARRLPAEMKLAITGTPMENNLTELWSLLSITAPGLFPNVDRFREFYARPIEKQGDAELLAQLRRRVKPLITRRTKEQVVADLPAKQEQVLEVELHPQHRKVYQQRLQRERQKILGLIDDMNRNRFTVLCSLTLLRQLSLHAALVDDAHQDLPCAKVDALLEQLQDVAAGGHRALVFSQFTRFLGIVRSRLDAAGVGYCYLDGTTRGRDRVVTRFKEGTDPVFLISIKAGGFGLNLTEADYCFVLDPWWNPATEAQAVDRTHRIGQTNNVMVYRLIAKDTIEEKVMALQARKAELFTSVMDEGGAFGTGLTAEDIRGLLG